VGPVVSAAYDAVLRRSEAVSEHGQVLQQRDDTEDDDDDPSDLLRAAVERKHVDEIEDEDDDQERDENTNDDVQIVPLRKNRDLSPVVARPESAIVLQRGGNEKPDQIETAPALDG